MGMNSAPNPSPTMPTRIFWAMGEQVSRRCVETCWLTRAYDCWIGQATGIHETLRSLFSPRATPCDRFDSAFLLSPILGRDWNGVAACERLINKPVDFIQSLYSTKLFESQ